MIFPDSLFYEINEAPIIEYSAVSGGSINQCYHLKLADNQEYFLKINSCTDFPELFRKEAAGLELLRTSGAFTPEVLNAIEDDHNQYLLLKWLPPEGETNESQRAAGEMLAKLHKNRQDYFGLNYDNYMGSLIQINNTHSDFADFWANCRILPLVEKCRDLSLLSRNDAKIIERLLNKISQLIPATKPCLIHGDLWSGNFHPSGGRIYLIDPAVAYSHPEADLAMMHLFGKPSAELMEAYFNNSEMVVSKKVCI